MTFQLIQDADPNLPTYWQIRPDLPADYQWYTEKLTGQVSLLVTLGDSWTWGDSLPLDQRTELIYGAVMARALDTDFVNIARCGAANIDIHDRLTWFLPQVIDRYEKITVIMTLTENGREIRHDPIWTDRTHVPASLQDFQIEYERVMFETFRNTLTAWPQVRFLIARNFTYTHDENKSILDDYLVPLTWVDVLAQEQNMPDYPANLRLLSQMAMTPMIAHFKQLEIYSQLKPEFFETFMAMEEAIEWFDRSALNAKRATKHPTEQGHRVWANYLLTHIC